MKLSIVVSGVLTLASCIGAQVSKYSNSSSIASDDLTTTVTSHKQVTLTATITAPPDPADASCTFAVLDSMKEVVFLVYSTTTVYSVVNLTSITSYITVYPTSSLTSVTTNVYTTNASFEWSTPFEGNLIHQYTNGGGGAQPSVSVEWTNATAITTGGTVVQSPTGFYVYDTVRLVSAAAVTDSNGKSACGVISSQGAPYLTTTSDGTRISSAVATTPYTTVTAVETLYSTYSDGLLSAITTVTKTDLVLSRTDFSFTWSYGTPYATTVTPYTYTNINTNMQEYFAENATITQAGVQVPLATPFVFIPPRGLISHTTNIIASVGLCDSSDYLVDYGYPPEELIEYMAGHAPYNTEFSGLGTYLPGGASIFPLASCMVAAPFALSKGGDLTSSTTIYITPTAEAAAPVVSTAEPVSTTVPKVAPETTNTPIATPTTSRAPVDTPEATETPTAIPEAAPLTQPTTAQEPAPGPETTTPTPKQEEPSTEKTSTTSSQAPVPAPASITTEKQPTTTSAEPPLTDDSTPTITSTPLGSIIASMVDASPITSPSSTIPTQLVVSTLATIPVRPGTTLSGLTTILNGQTQVLVSTLSTIAIGAVPTTIPLPTQELPGSATVISGTTNVVISGPTTIPVNPQLPSLSGSTTVISGSSYVVISAPTTVPVIPVPYAPTTTGANSTVTGYIQIAGAGVRNGFSWLLVLGVMGVGRLAVL